MGNERSRTDVPSKQGWQYDEEEHARREQKVSIDLRLPASLHRRLKDEADRQVVSMSLLVTRALEGWFAARVVRGETQEADRG